jgi:hypothetical protein
MRTARRILQYLFGLQAFGLLASVPLIFLAALGPTPAEFDSATPGGLAVWMILVTFAELLQTLDSPVQEAAAYPVSSI